MAETAGGWIDGWPSWKDSGRRVVLRMPDGSLLSGMLSADDVGFDGEDDYPIFFVHCDDGQAVSFASHDEWKFAE